MQRKRGSGASVDVEEVEFCGCKYVQREHVK